MTISQAFKNEPMMKAITGLTLHEFEILLETFEKVVYERFATRKRARRVGGGRKGARLNIQ